MNKKILSLIPARSGSKGIKNKNIREINGKPLIAYSIIVSNLSKFIQRTIVSTDSERIQEISYQYGAESPFLRPYQYAQDDSTDIEWLKHALEWLKTNEDYEPDLIVHLRPTTPLRDIKIIDSAISKILQCPEATSLRSVHLFEESPYKMFIKEDQYLKPFMKYENGEFYNLPRQHFPQVYFPNGYVDILRPKTIYNGSLHGDKILAFETDKAIEIDGIKDLQLLEMINFDILPIYSRLKQYF